MAEMFHQGNRELQDRFDTRRLADRIEEKLVSDTIGPHDAAFIQAMDMFFIATADAEGTPNCPRYIHRMQVVEHSAFVPQEGCVTPVPEWKRAEWSRDYLPAADPARDPNSPVGPA